MAPLKCSHHSALFMVNLLRYQQPRGDWVTEDLVIHSELTASTKFVVRLNKASGKN